MPAHQRKLIKNHFVIGFIPFEGKFDKFMIPFISEIKELEKGKFLKESSIKRNETAMIQQRIDAFQVKSVPKIIIFCWIYVAKTMKAVFNKKFTSDSYKELQQCLEEEFSILLKVFVNFVNLPNIHVNMHLLMHAKTFGTLINTQVGIKEMVHHIFKRMVPKTNCKNIDLDLLKRYNTLFAIRHLADGEAKKDVRKGKNEREREGRKKKGERTKGGKVEGEREFKKEYPFLNFKYA
ncbi:hypothetical protein GLOIN_2v1836760 [Rhizophagus irregularis DAOM 181602=DAOM 197198]|nr:hypothetical protein GLOIN_2v1836760 [Rhizophagus irregularis DAOM 181602=DAOM 197198]